MRAFKRDGGVIKRNGEGKLGCCCAGCSVDIYGEVFTLTLSGVASCGCLGDPIGGYSGIIGTVPSSFEMTWNGAAWASPQEGYAVFRSGDDCDGPDGVDGHFEASAFCSDDQLFVQVYWVDPTFGIGSVLVYGATFEGPGTNQANTVLCSNGEYFGDGNGSI